MIVAAIVSLIPGIDALCIPSSRLDSHLSGSNVIQDLTKLLKTVGRVDDIEVPIMRFPFIQKYLTFCFSLGNNQTNNRIH